MKRRLLVLSLTALLAGAFALPAFAQQDDDYPPEGVGITLHDSDGNVSTAFVAGETGTVDASELLANTTYDSKFDQSPGVVIGTGESDSDGDFHDTFRIPTSADVGPATFCLDPRGTSDGDVCVGIRIVSSAGDDGVSLPKTGTAIATYVAIGLALIVVGTILVRIRRSRRRGQSAPERELQNV